MVVAVLLVSILCTVRSPRHAPAASEEDDPQLFRWFGPNITRAMLAPRPIDVSWIVRYKLLSGRIFVHKRDRAAILDNVTCKSCDIVHVDTHMLSSLCVTENRMITCGIRPDAACLVGQRVQADRALVSQEDRTFRGDVAGCCPLVPSPRC